MFDLRAIPLPSPYFIGIEPINMAVAQPHSLTSVHKLRNSCEACASSKLKCAKEKPKCSRCAKRGLACDYFLVKKAGRKPNSRPSVARTSSSNSFINLPPPPSPSCSLEAVHLQSPDRNISETADMLRDLFGPTDQSMCTTFTNTDTNFDDYFSSPMSLSTNGFDLNIFENADFMPTATNDGSNNAFENIPNAFGEPRDTVSKVLAFPFVDIAIKPLVSLSNEPRHHQELYSMGTSCSCLGQALALMRQISAPSGPNTCTTWSAQGPNTASGKPSIQAVIAQNKDTITAMSMTLNCSCLQNGYLLTVMSLIIFQVLDWYAAVARGAPSVQILHTGRSPSPSISEQALPDSTTVGNFCLEGEDSARMTAQLVLAELHCVRRLIDQLSPKLRVHAAANEEAEGAEAPESRAVRGETALPLSAGVYIQMDVDLRRRLKAVSWEIIDLLKRL